MNSEFDKIVEKQKSFIIRSLYENVDADDNIDDKKLKHRILIYFILILLSIAIVTSVIIFSNIKINHEINRIKVKENYSMTIDMIKYQKGNI